MLRRTIILLIFSSLVLAQELSWSSTSGPMGGLIGDMAVNSEGEIFAGAYSLGNGYHGLFKSTDDGYTWEMIETEFYPFDVYAVFIDSKDQIWVGTNYQDRIYFSADNGESWQIKANNYLGFECWAFGESLDGVLFAGNGDGGNLSRSTDNGETWEYINNLAVLTFATDSNNVIYAGTFLGFYSSTDNGLTWNEDEFMNDKAIPTIKVDKFNNIYCGTGYGSYYDGDGIYYSSNSGLTWENLGLSGQIVLSIEFDSQSNLYAGTIRNGVYKTSDFGRKWTNSTVGLYQKSVDRMIINEDDEILIGSEGEGIYKSIDGGSIFKQVGLPVTEVVNFVTSGDSLLLAATYSGVQKYTRNERKWENIGLTRALSVAVTPNKTIYATIANNTLHRSTDFGENWEPLYPAGDTLNFGSVQALNNDTLFCKAGAFYSTTNGGNSWLKNKKSNGNFTNGMIYEPKSKTLWTLFSNHSKNRYELMYSQDLGESFVEAYSGFNPGRSLTPFYVLEDSQIFLNQATRENSVVLRTDWENYFWEPVLQIPFIGPMIYAENTGRVITSTTKTSYDGENKIYISDNFGETWSNNSIPGSYYSVITDVKKSEDGQYFIGTSTNGIYELDILINSIEDEKVINGYRLTQNYPNPFNPTTTIKFTIPNVGEAYNASRNTKLIVYDILGREIKTLLNKPMQPGSYEIEFDGSNLTSGVYFYVLETRDKRLSKKMLLIK